jgi:hypothetical protein
MEFLELALAHLLVKDGLGLPAKSPLFSVVATLPLGHQRGGARFVLRHFVLLVQPALFAMPAKSTGGWLTVSILPLNTRTARP